MFLLTKSKEKFTKGKYFEHLSINYYTKSYYFELKRHNVKLIDSKLNEDFSIIA